MNLKTRAMVVTAVMIGAPLATAAAAVADCVDVKGTPAVPAQAAITHNVTVVDTPAVPATESTPEVDAVTHVVHHEAVTHVVHHTAVTHEETVIDTPEIPAVHIPGVSASHIDAITHTEIVVDTAAYDETVTDTAAYDEVVHHAAVTHTVHHAAVTHEESQYIKQVRTSANGEWFPYDGDCNIHTVGDAKAAWSADTDANIAGVQVPGIWSSGTFTLDAVGSHSCGQYRYHAIGTRTVTDHAAYDETVVDHAAYDETVHHAAVTHVVHHEAVTHTAVVVDVPAVDIPAIPAIDIPAIPAVTHQITITDTEAYNETVVDHVAYDETVVDSAAIPAVPGTPFVPAVTHSVTIVDKAAVPAKPAVKAVDCPTALPHTGGYGQADFAMAAVAGLLVLGGSGVVIRSRRRR